MNSVKDSVSSVFHSESLRIQVNIKEQVLADINISYLSVNLSSAERPKVISILSGLKLCTFIVMCRYKS